MKKPDSLNSDNLSDLRERALAVLREAGVPAPEVDAELLIAHALDIGRGELQARMILDRPVPTSPAAAISEMLERRARREPLQHILGYASFRSLTLAVGRGVFVPRPET